MIIHVVKQGESLYSIAKLYGVPYGKIASDNELRNPEQLVIGQAIVIMEGTRRHKVVSGESLYSVAGEYGISVNRLMAANPQVRNTVIYPGDILRVPPSTAKLGTLEVNGYAFPTITGEVLRKTLPYLTYLSIFSYQVKPDGSLTPINDEVLIREARRAGVAPLMVISNIDAGGGFSSDLVRTILTDQGVQDRLLDNAIANMRAKNYYGLDVDFEFIPPELRENYNDFLRKAADRLKPAGYTLTTALAPKTSAEQKGLLYEAHDYPVHGALTNHVIIMTYEWGYTYGPAMAVAPIGEVRKVLNYAVTAIPANKILMGIPNYGYDWTLPFTPGSMAESLSNVEAVNRALRVKAAIEYDTASESPFYRYYDKNGKQHEVWFEDARSIDAKLRLAHEKGLGGVSYWTINRYFPQNWLVLSGLFNIRKVI